MSKKSSKKKYTTQSKRTIKKFSTQTGQSVKKISTQTTNPVASVEKNAHPPKISVIVPVYNVEKYLPECLDSIIAQTLSDLEIILIDDGSTDSSGKIADDYAKKDARLKIIHQENHGYSYSVNRGISLAHGEYIGLVESDDWIEPTMYQELYNNAKKLNTDITKAMFYNYNSKAMPSDQNHIWTGRPGIDLRRAPSGTFTVTDWPEIIAFHASLWSSIYRRDFLRPLRLPDTAGASYQDFPFMISLMTHAKSISVVKKPLLHWRNEPDQHNSTSGSGKKLLFMPRNTLTALLILKKSGNYSALKSAFYAQAFWANWDFILRITPKYLREYFDLMCEIFYDIWRESDYDFRFLTNSDRRYLKLFKSRRNYLKFRLFRAGYNFAKSIKK